MDRSTKIFLLSFALIILPSNASDLNSETRLNCNGKEFKCVNATHFQLCSPNGDNSDDGLATIYGVIESCIAGQKCDDLSATHCDTNQSSNHKHQLKGSRITRASQRIRLIKGNRATNWRPRLSLQTDKEKEYYKKLRERTIKQRRKQEIFIDSILAKEIPSEPKQMKKKTHQRGGDPNSNGNGQETEVDLDVAIKDPNKHDGDDDDDDDLDDDDGTTINNITPTTTAATITNSTKFSAYRARCADRRTFDVDFKRCITEEQIVYTDALSPSNVKPGRLRNSLSKNKETNKKKSNKKKPNAKWQKCVTLYESQSNVTTMDEYKKFDFHPDWKNKKEFWDDSLEERYEQIKVNTTTPNLEVFLFLFSHNDPGWVKTFIEYFEQDSRSILDNVVAKMEEYEYMTFVWAEISFLQLWWDQAPEAKKQSLTKLVQSGRFEIVTGGWVMPDEANTHIYGLINQLIEGHQWLRLNLNCTPTSGFSIDPFGHGSTWPYLLAASGFDGTIIQRVHFAWKQFLAKKQYGDFYWKPYWNDGSTSDARTLLTHNMPFDVYWVEVSCGPHTAICQGFRFPFISDAEIQLKADIMVTQYAKTASLLPHNVALVPLGGDFDYKSTWSIDSRYQNYKKLADYVNANPKRYNNTHISFGLPRDYFAEVKKRQKDFPHLKGDFFVYADVFTSGRPAYWSGYYTTRPMYKILNRELEHNLRSAEILFTVALNRANQQNDTNAIRRIHEKNYEKLTLARRNSGLFQHHDAITGTSKERVMQDYGLRLFQSIQDTMRLQENAIEFLLQNTTKNHDFIVSELKRKNFRKLSKKRLITVDPNRSVEVILFNALAQPRHELISLHVNSPFVKLFDDQAKEVKIQISPKWNFNNVSYKVNFESFQIRTNMFELQFVANLPSLTLVKYTVKYSAIDEEAKQYNSMATIYGNNYGENPKIAPFEIKSLQNGSIEMENRLIRLVCNDTNGLLQTINFKNRNETIQCDMNFAAYRSARFRSGAYLFEPKSENPVQNTLDLYNDDKIVFKISGPLTTDVTVVYGDFLMHTIRIFTTDTALDNGVFIQNDLNYDIVHTSDTEFFMRVATNISNGANPVFYSDQNRFQYQRREKVQSIGIEGNYYPITSGAFIQDKKHRLTLLTTHAQGAASLEQGFLEVMMDRRTLYDDDRGVHENVVDNQLTRQTYWLIFEELIDLAPSKEHHSRTYETPSHFVNRMTNMHDYPVQLYFVERQEDSISLQLKSTVPLIEVTFPCDVHLTTLRTQTEKNLPMFPSRNAFMVLHRQSASCNVKKTGFKCHNDYAFNAKSLNLFFDLHLESMEATSLTGIKSIEQIQSLDQIYIKPMDIVTFNLTFV